ncbi:MAG: redoxin domain-containing protein, partial [Flavobacteriales bacterium]|nr:redoxin domain-containing protein [Flavobacteriales bacterium]
LKQSAQRPDWPIAGMVAIVTVAFMWYSYAYLPTRDYRPYAVGENILEQMKSAEELGLPAPEYVYDYTMVNQDTGEEMVITSKEYMDEKWWERKEWAIDKERTGSARKVKDGYEPPITDFSFQDEYGDEASYRFLESEKPVLLVLTYDVESSDDAIEEVSALAEELLSKNVEVFGLSASAMEQIEDFRHEYQLAFPYFQGDEKVIKTVVRSNPGLVLLDGATILEKWSAASVPEVDEVMERIQAQ